jgi:hypothetical protein
MSKVRDIVRGPPHMDESMWYILIGVFAVIWMWMVIWS